MTKQTETDLLAAIEQHMQRQALAAEVQAKDVLDLRQAAFYLSLEYNTLKQTYLDRGLPHSKVGAQVYFSKDDLRAYMMANRRRGMVEIEDMADQYVNRPRHRR